MIARTLEIFVFILIAMSGSAVGQNLPVGASAGESEEDHLARTVNDPAAMLMQLQLQDLYAPRNFQTSAQTNTIQSRLIIPIQPFALLPIEQIVRPTFSVKTLATSQSSSTITEFRDIQLLDLFVPPWEDPKGTGFGWGVGPTFVFPTGRDSAAGKHAWEAGPAVGAAYRGIPHLMIGFLFQNPISFGYTNSSATPQNQMEFQPRISYTLGHGWYVKSSDSTWTVNWRHNTSTTLPISFGFGRVWKFPGPQIDTWVSGEWTAYRQFATITPMYRIRFGVTLVFPHLEL
jgi:hypothetical protein